MGVGSINQGRWRRPSRLEKQAQNNLGIIMTDTMNSSQMFRDNELDIYDQYYESTQYDDLRPWDECGDGSESAPYVPVRKRKPRIIYALPKVLVNKVAAKICGSSMFPSFIVEEDPDDTEFFRAVMKAANFRARLLQPVKHTLISGSAFVRYYLVNGAPKIEHFNSKFCYPIFDDMGELESMTVRYVYEDPNDKDAKGGYKCKWYQLTLSKTVDTLFDNPEFQPGSSTLPQFTAVSQTQHDLGWVQGEWLRTSEHKFDPDGHSLIGDILDFFDELNYSLSQTSQAVGYNQDPQLTFKNIDEEELDKLIRSSQKGWDLGRDGEAAFLETNLEGVATAETQRDHMRNLLLDVVRVVIHDPEKMVAAAQSGKALEVLNAPLVELIDELRTMFEPSFRNLLIKIGMTMLKSMADGFDTVLDIPPGYVPASLDITVSWPPMYPLTLQDLVLKVQAASSAAQQHIISHKTATQYVAKDFGVENVDEEIAQIADEGQNDPWLNPFGMGFGGPGGQ